MTGKKYAELVNIASNILRTGVKRQCNLTVFQVGGRLRQAVRGEVSDVVANRRCRAEIAKLAGQHRPFDLASRQSLGLQPLPDLADGGALPRPGEFEGAFKWGDSVHAPS